MKKFIFFLIILVLVIGGYYAQQAAPKETPIATVLYLCDGGKTLSAAYYKGPEMPTPKPGEMPVPSGYVELSIDGTASTTLVQTISASGIRYATPDESLVFWSKGDSALLMRNNTMDLEYTNCTTGGARDPKNATYLIEGERVTLTDGVAETQAAPDSASKIVTRYFGNDLAIDLDGDGDDDTAFILTQESGGSGVFFYAVAALKTDDGYQGSDGYLLGDRIAPQTITPSPNPQHKYVVVFNYADRLPNEPMTARPSQGKSAYLKINPDTMQWGIVVPDFEGESR